MVASIPDLILGLPAGAALLIVFLVPALEPPAFLGSIFPGEIAVILGGVLASQGKFPLWAAIAASVLGAIVGDSIGYVALGASILVFATVRAFVDRPRPPVSDWLANVSGPSFPSGHSADAAAAYGMLAVLVLATDHKRKTVALAAALAVVPVVVAASRLYLGVHWFTDVVAGFALGWAVVAIVVAVTLLLPPASRRPRSDDPRSPML